MPTVASIDRGCRMRAMARPVGANPEQTKQNVLEAAVQLFSDRGETTSLRDVAKAAGVTVGTVQHYFGNKAGLQQAVEDAFYEELAPLQAELMAAAVQEPRDPHSILERVVERTYTFIREHLTAVRLQQRQVLATGVVPRRGRDEFLGPLLDNGSVVVAGLTGTTPERARFALLSMNHLVIRFGLTSDDELVRWMNVGQGEGPFTAAQHQQAIDAAQRELVALFALQCGVAPPGA